MNHCKMFLGQILPMQSLINIAITNTMGAIHHKKCQEQIL